MIKSMTGFGSVEINDKSNQITILIRSINGRFLDIKFRGIDIDPQFELEIRKEIQKTIIRGNVNVQIFIKNDNKNNSLKFDEERYKSIEKIVSKIQTDYGKHLEIGELLSINDLTTNIDFDDFDKKVLMNGVKDVLKQLDKMRRNEGSTIKNDLEKRILSIQKSLKEILKESEQYIVQLNKDYKERIKSLVEDVSVDDDRLAQEIAIIVDKYDFTEEVVRSNSHCEQFANYLNSKEPAGKNLNFILQELVREVNTIGSKSPSSDISNTVVEIKSEIERIREQVQNIL